MITAFTDKGKLVLPVDGSVQVTYTNPLTQQIGSQSVPISLPYVKENLEILGHPERIQSQNRFQTSRDAYLQVDSFFQAGKLRLFQCSRAEGMPSTFYFGGGSLYSDMRDNLLMTDLPWPTRNPYTGDTQSKVTAWLDHLSDVMNRTVSDDYFVFPVSYSFTPNTGTTADNSYTYLTFQWLNGLKWVDNNTTKLLAYDSQTELNGSDVVSLPYGYGVTPFLKVSYVLRKLFSFFGYTLKENIFDTDPDLMQLVELNNTADAIVNGTLQEVQLVPDQTVKDYLKAVSARFNVQFVPNDNDKTVTVWSWNDAINTDADMDLTPLICEDEKIEYVDPEPLELSESTGIQLSGTALDTYVKFIKKYPTAQGLFDNRMQAYFLNGARLSSNFFGILPVGTSMESIAAGDSAVPMISVSINASVTDGIVFLPLIDARRNMNSQLTLNGVQIIEDVVNLDLMFCFAVPNKQSASFTQNSINYQLSYYQGSSNCYDSTGNQWGSTTIGYMGENGAYDKFFTGRDEVKKTSYHSITVNIALNSYQLNKLVNSIHKKKLYKNQPVLIDTMQVDLGDVIGTTQLILRTLRKYNDVATDVYTIRWDKFVCELAADSYPVNLISVTFSGSVFTVSATQNVTTNVKVDLNVTYKWHDNLNPSMIFTLSTRTTVTIPSGQKQVSSDINTTNEYYNITATAFVSITPAYDSNYLYLDKTSGNSGFQRSLTLALDITYLSGFTATNYYDGKQAFTMNGNAYATITDADLQALPLADFNTRLADWVAYFNLNYRPGFPDVVVDPTDARIYNASICPLTF
jgi:hypothetical protein